MGSVDTRKKEKKSGYRSTTGWQVCTDIGPLYSSRSLQIMRGALTLADMRSVEFPPRRTHLHDGCYL